MSAMNGGSLWRSCMGLLSLTLPTKVNLSRNEEGSAEQNTRSFSARGGSLGLGWRWETSHPGVLSVSLNFGGKGIGETNGSGRLRLAQLGTNWWTGGLAWNLTGRSGK